MSTRPASGRTDGEIACVRRRAPGSMAPAPARVKALTKPLRDAANSELRAGGSSMAASNEARLCQQVNMFILQSANTVNCSGRNIARFTAGRQKSGYGGRKEFWIHREM